MTDEKCTCETTGNCPVCGEDPVPTSPVAAVRVGNHATGGNEPPAENDPTIGASIAAVLDLCRRASDAEGHLDRIVRAWNDLDHNGRRRLGDSATYEALVDAIIAATPGLVERDTT